MKIKSILSKEEIMKLQARHASEIERILVRRGFNTDDARELAAKLDIIVNEAAKNNEAIQAWVAKTNKKNADADAKIAASKATAKAKRDKKKADVVAALNFMKQEAARRNPISAQNNITPLQAKPQQQITHNQSLNR